MWTEAALAIAANILAITAFFYSKKIRERVSNYFILNLSICDLLVGITVIPLNNLFVYYGYWPFGKVICKVWLLFVYACTVVSGFALVLISWDRFTWVRAPLLYIHYQTKKRAVCVITITALVCYVFVSLVDIEWEALSGERNINYTLMCKSEGIHFVSYAVITFVFEFVLPAGLLATFNALVFVKIRRILLARQRTESGTINISIDKDKGQNHSCSSRSTGSGLAQAEGSSHPLRQPGPQAYRKSALMLSIMTGAFVICWFPWFIAVFVHALGVYVSPGIFWGLSYLMYANSAINPFLYAYTNVHYKAQMMSFICFFRRR